MADQPIDWVSARQQLAATGLYDPTDEHDACGVGTIVAIDGRPRRDVVLKGIEALKSVWHRGAVDADGKTGDGAGIHVQIPHAFFEDFIRKGGQEINNEKFAVGQIFLPRTDLSKQERCRVIVEREILNYGYTIYGWRQVPVNIGVIGEKGNASRPEIEQIMIANNRGASEEQFETDLYVIRRRIEKAAAAEGIGELYICSLSCRSVIYKGMFLAEHLTAFYPDLLDERFVSNFAIYHQRYSTNTFPTWSLAQPFRVIAHNGEINTLKGNVNWMTAHETRMDSGVYGEHMAELKPVVQSGGSDSAALDNVFEIMVTEERPLPMVRCLLVPDVWADRETMPQSHKDLFSYCNSVMEPWDGPAAICGFAGNWVIAFTDRNGLRPLRYAITDDGLLVAGSETGMVRLMEERVIAKSRLGPGQMIAVDLTEGRLYSNDEMLDKLTATADFSNWVTQITVIDDLVRETRGQPTIFERDLLRRRQVGAGLSLEDLELILQPMVEE
ncbi:MAG TPA: glutamate synthase large subunit, partial [Dongiaceae bacterium]